MQQLTPQRILFIISSVLSEQKWELWPSFTHLNSCYFYLQGMLKQTISSILFKNIKDNTMI